MEQFDVRLPEFEGPLDLLLYLVKKEKIDILRISLSALSEQYLQYLRRMRFGDLGLLAEYLLMAATLLYLKSKALLPKEERGKEEEELEEDLKRRLLRYSVFQKARQWLKERPLLGWDVFTRSQEEQESEEEFKVEIGALIESAKRVLLKEKREKGSAYRPLKVLDLKRKIAELLDLLGKLGRLKVEGKRELIPLFLAALELAKRGLVVLLQEEPFSEVWVSLRWEEQRELAL
jgi:segregation and condensation protein A